jgi:hypothetical protein
MNIPHPHQLFDFSGQVAIVTGSGRGRKETGCL